MTPPSNAGGEGREVLANIRARICEQGDMHITISADEMVTLRQALGLNWWEDQEESREIDAMALEMLCVAAEKRAAMLAFSARENADDRAPALVEAAVAEAITAAIGKADEGFRYSFNLTRLVDGEETHTLFMNGFEPVEFGDRDDGYRLIAERRNKARADAVLAAIRALETPSQEASNVG